MEGRLFEPGRPGLIHIPDLPGSTASVLTDADGTSERTEELARARLRSTKPMSRDDLAILANRLGILEHGDASLRLVVRLSAPQIG